MMIQEDKILAIKIIEEDLIVKIQEDLIQKIEEDLIATDQLKKDPLQVTCLKKRAASLDFLKKTNQKILLKKEIDQAHLGHHLAIETADLIAKNLLIRVFLF
jgi:hypothetical protein